MAELYEDWLVSPMTRAEYNELNDEEKEERKRLQKRNVDRKYYKSNNEKIKTQTLKYYNENTDQRKQKIAVWQTTEKGKKSKTISRWINDLGLQESPKDLDRIYELYLHQELCNACECVLTRDGNRCNTYASMDHDHDTHRFRHIICHKCNSHDNWKKYFC